MTPKEKEKAIRRAKAIELRAADRIPPHQVEDARRDLLWLSGVVLALLGVHGESVV